MGCRRKVKGLQIKNVMKEHGGTKQFTVFLSDSPQGPWDSVLITELTEQEHYGCDVMKTFDLE